MFVSALGRGFEDPIDPEEVLAAAREARIGVEDVPRLIAVEDAVAGESSMPGSQ